MSARGLNRNDGAHGKLAGGQSKGMLEGPELPALRLALRTCYRIPVYVGGQLATGSFAVKTPKIRVPTSANIPPSFTAYVPVVTFSASHFPCQ